MIYIKAPIKNAKMTIAGNIFSIVDFRIQKAQELSQGYICYGIVKTVNASIKRLENSEHSRIDIRDISREGKYYIFSNTRFRYVDDDTGEFSFEAKRSKVTPKEYKGKHE